MKTHIWIKAFMVMAFMAVTAPSFSNDKITPVTVHESDEVKAARLTERLEQIKAMDHKSLSRDERKALRRDVRAIKEEMAAMRGGVYLSVGAIIIIILLLILLV